MKGFIQNVEGITVKNEDFRRVLYTARNCQLVVMALNTTLVISFSKGGELLLNNDDCAGREALFRGSHFDQ